MLVICFGSAIIEIWATEDGKTTKTVFTGDIGNNDIPLLDSPTMIESADYLVNFMSYMGDDVFKVLKTIYDEDRIGYLKEGNINGLTTAASFINSQYITYAPRLDYFDSLIISHEVGHIIHQNLMILPTL